MAEYDLGTARGKIEIDAEGAKQGINDATQATDQLGNSAGRNSQSVAIMGGALLGVGAAAVGGFAIAVNAAADFESQLSGFKAVTGSTVEQIDAIREKAMQLGRDTAFGAGEAAGAMTELGKAGIPVEGILNGAADATVALAAAGEIDLAQAAKISAAALNQFKLEAEDLPGVADILAGAANASATGVSEIGLAFEYVGPVAAAAGMSLEDTAGAIALLSNNGIDAGKAGTSLRSILSQLQPTTDKAQTAMKELGLWTEESGSAFYDAAGNIKPMNEVVGLLNSSMSDLTAEQQMAYAEAMFGKEALAAISAVAGTTQEEFDALQKSIGDVSAQEVADEKLNNLSGSMTILKGTIETFLIGAGSPFLGMMKSIVDRITSVINTLGQMPESVQKMVGMIVLGIGVFATLAGALVMATLAFQKFKTVMVGLKIGAALTNPIFLVLAALALVGYALYKLYQESETFRDVVKRAFEAIEPAIDAVKTAFKGLIEFVQSVVSVFTGANNQTTVLSDRMLDLANTVGYRLMSAFEQAKTAIQGVVEFVQSILSVFTGANNQTSVLSTGMLDLANTIGYTLMGAFQSAVSFITGTLIPIITQVGTVLFNVFSAILGAVVPFAIGLVTQLVQWFVTMIPEILATVTHVFNTVKTVITTILTVLGVLFRQWLNVARAMWRAWGDDLLNMVGTAWTAIKTVIESAIKVVQGIIKTVLALIRGDWGAAWDGIKMILAGAWDAIVGIVKGAVGLFKGVITGFVSTLIEVWNGLWEKLKGLLSAAWNAIFGLAKGYISTLVGFYVGLPGKILGAIGDLAGIIANFFTTAFNKMKEAASTGVSNLLSTLGGLPGKIVSAVGNLGSVLYNAGKDILSGLIRGVTDKIGELKNKLNSVTSMIPDWKGPPKRDKKLLEENGQLIMQGLVSGLDSGMKDLENYLGSVTASIPASMDVNGTVSHSALGSAAAAGAGTSITVGQVVIPAKDLEEMRNVQDFFDRIQQVARQGV